MPVKEFIRQALDMTRKDMLQNVLDLSASELAWRVVPHANSIGFLLWHLARVEDGWIQRPVQRKPHLWVSEAWFEKFGMPEDQRDMGYNYTVQQIESFKTPPLDLLMGYSESVRDATLVFLDSWDPESASPEVRAPWGTITVSDVFQTLIWEGNQHAGQIAYIRGLMKGLQRPDYMGPLSTS